MAVSSMETGPGSAPPKREVRQPAQKPAGTGVQTAIQNPGQNPKRIRHAFRSPPKRAPGRTQVHSPRRKYDSQTCFPGKSSCCGNRPFAPDPGLSTTPLDLAAVPGTPASQPFAGSRSVPFWNRPGVPLGGSVLRSSDDCGHAANLKVPVRFHLESRPASRTGPATFRSNHRIRNRSSVWEPVAVYCPGSGNPTGNPVKNAAPAGTSILDCRAWHGRRVTIRRGFPGVSGPERTSRTETFRANSSVSRALPQCLATLLRSRESKCRHDPAQCPMENGLPVRQAMERAGWTDAEAIPRQGPLADRGSAALHSGMSTPRGESGQVPFIPIGSRRIRRLNPR